MPAVQDKRRPQGRVGEVIVLPGGAVVQRQRGKGVPHAKAGAGAQVRIADTIIVGDDQRLGLRPGVDELAAAGVGVGAVAGIVLQLAGCRVWRLALGILGGHVQPHGAHRRGPGHLLRGTRDVPREQGTVVRCEGEAGDEHGGDDQDCEQGFDFHSRFPPCWVACPILSSLSAGGRAFRLYPVLGFG